MPAKGYCQPSDVAAYLGVTFSPAQTALAPSAIANAEAYIDRFTARGIPPNQGWLQGAITAERYDLTAPTLFLAAAPVTAVSLVQTRTRAVGDTLYTAIPNVDYEVLDLRLGQITFRSGYSGPQALAFVSYTPNRPVPADITDAAVQIAAAMMEYALYPERYGVASQRLADLDTRYDTSVRGALALPIPARAQAILDGYRRPVLA